MSETTTAPPGTTEARALLVDLLKEAAQLEHCLLNAYLYAASSLRSTPQEFAEVGGVENRRRAIQFERVRLWKQALYDVAREEMLHLHYVECMLRGLGEPPCFDLPARDRQSGSWVIPNWRMRVGPGPESEAVQVPVAPLTPEVIRNFVLYESSNSLQDDDPFGPTISALFARLHQFEVDLQLESALLYVADDARRQRMKDRLGALLSALPPVPPEERHLVAPLAPAPLPPVEDLRFQSIADFYYKGILPLYEEAYEYGWVVNSNRNLTYELLNPGYASEGLLPIGPVYRDKNFEREARERIESPLRDYKDVQGIVREIVEEGEGATNFEGRAERLLAKVAELGGARAYLSALLAERGQPTPPWLAEGELLRKSHLYRFAMIWAQWQEEQRLAEEAGVQFDPTRRPLAVRGAALTRLAEELPTQLNACYLVLLAWLARIYETREWMADAPRRVAIEMLASWPLMSLAIRPFLELASLVQVELNQLFRFDAAALPLLPVHAQELERLYSAPERSEEINVRMDFLAVRVLSDVARWADAQREVVAEADVPTHARELMLARLRQLTELSEFEKQFPFRVHGGYSDRMPDVAYQRSQLGADAFEEDPTRQDPLYQESLVLRLRFAGRGLVQLATDPDPPLDEAGCLGTMMLHAADGDRRLDRSLVWQEAGRGHAIRREPRAALPALGVNVVEASLLAAAGGVSAGYVPIQVMQQTGVQTSGVQQTLQVQGLDHLLTLGAAEIVGEAGSLRVDLEDKGGERPFLNGLNHLTSQDGEPIDPFVLAVSDGEPAGDGAGLLFRREVFNDGLSLLAMDPLQRLFTSRQPCGFDADLSHIPEWAMSAFSERERQLLASGYPMSYVADRAGALAQALEEQLEGGDQSRHHVDVVASFSERLRRISVPRRTVIAWLRILLHYGHTLSGRLEVSQGHNPILAAFSRRTNLVLGLAGAEARDRPNGRWLVTYTKGLMDTDALADFVFGELYVPLQVEPGDGPMALGFTWRFPRRLESAVAEYGCDFSKPFWAAYAVEGETRTLPLPDGALVETLERARRRSYSYSATGIAGVEQYRGTFTVADVDGGEDGATTELSWNVTFTSAAPAAIVRVLSHIGAAANQMSSALEAHFRPRSASGS